MAKPLNQQLETLPTTIFTVMSALAREHNAINLGQGFPDTEGPHDIAQTAASALLDGQNQYAPLTGLPELRQAVAESNARFQKLTIDPDTEVVITSGATEALAASLMALITPGDEIVLIEPLYDTYLPVILQAGGIPRVVRLEHPDWTLPRQALADAFSARTKAILLNTPMNPAGKVFSYEELSFIAELIKKHDTYALCDEVYEHLTFGTPHISLMTLPDMRDRCIRIGSAGKSFSMTGWKVGYITASAPLAAVIAKAHQNLVFSTAPNLQRAVAFGLRKDTRYFTEMAAGFMKKRDILSDGLRRLGLDVLPCHGSYFIMADISSLARGEDDTTFARTLTVQAGVATIPASAFYSPLCGAPPQHLLRFAFCKQEHILHEALARIEAWCEKR